MRYDPIVITGPTSEPISLTELKLHCRIDASDATQDDLLTACIKAARAHFEWRTSRTIHQQTLECVLDAFPGDTYIELPRATPLISPITSLIYKDSDGNLTTWAASNYIADVDSIPGRLVLTYSNSWPSFTAYPVSAVRIRYLAGIATTSPVTEADERIKAPVKMMAAALFENPEALLLDQQDRISQICDAFIGLNVAKYVF